MERVQIRRAKKQDMKSVLNLIEELADFEKMKKEVKISVEDLERDGFDTHPSLYSCYVAESTKFNIVGYAIFYNTYSTWLGKSLFLEDLYVQAQYRKKNIGKNLFLAVAKDAYLNAARLDFEVLSWNPALDFYKENFGAVNLTESETWQRLRLDKESLKKLFE